MHQRIARVTLIVKEYDEAIEFYTQKLSFQLIEDVPIPDEDKRWVVIAPPGTKACQILLVKAANEVQVKAIGNQAGDQVFLFLFTDDFWRDYEAMKAKGIHFIRLPKKEVYGTVAVFADLYGNLWDLIEPSE